jgi:glycosyltransferase involved in cell wall biosynthesis
MVKVLMINSQENEGGAAIACQRLMDSLLRFTDLEVKLLCLEKKSDKENTSSTGSKFKIYLEKLSFLFYEKSKKQRFAFSTGQFGNDISKHDWVQEADIIHLHWVNQGFLSVKDIGKLLELNKPVFWTMHDMWPFTGGCHQSNDCKNYEVNCGQCEQFLRVPSEIDLSFQILKRKEKWNLSSLKVISVSQLMNTYVSQSSLFKNVKKYSIPNPLDSSVFKRLSKPDLRVKWGLDSNKTYLLFTAAIIDNYFKGFDMFLEISEGIKKLELDIEVLFVGEFKSYNLDKFPLAHKHLGTINNATEMAEVYNLADIYLSTSPNESFSYTVLEAVFCGIYTIGYDTGEIGPVITSSGNGQVIKNYNSKDFLNALQSFSKKKELKNMSNNLEKYSYKIVGEDVLNAYKEQLTQLGI